VIISAGSLVLSTPSSILLYSPSFILSMALQGPNSQRRYFPQQESGSNSTTNLLQSQSSASAPHAHYAQRPSLRTMPSTSSLVRSSAFQRSALLIRCPQSESPYSSVSATFGGRAAAPSVSDKVSRRSFPNSFTNSMLRSIPFLPTLLCGVQIFLSLTRKTTIGYIIRTPAGTEQTMRVAAF